ncbi:MAG: hypothetical protein ACI4D6_07105, partial [Chordicoccus sp.]
DRSAFQQFANEERDIVLTITGTGPVRAAAGVGAVLGSAPADTDYHAVNFGSCAAVSGVLTEPDAPGESRSPAPLYVIHKLTNTESGRQWYPDLLPGNGLPEAEIFTGSMLYDGAQKDHMTDEMREDRGIPALSRETRLYDMESAAFFEVANLYIGPHRIHVLKFVTDSGETEHITPDIVRHAAEVAVPQAAEYLRLIADRTECERTAVPDIETLAEQLHASSTMRAQLLQLVRYADLMRIEWRGLVHQWADLGLFPAKDRRAGKRLLAELRDMIQGM